MALEEKWRVCVQDCKYEVSSTGRVRSKRRPEKILKPWVVKNTKYLQIMLSARKKHSMHRLVASAFCDGEKDGLCVNHKNGIRADNRAENLEWVTYSENCAHAFRELGRENPYKGRTGSDHPTSKAIVSRDPVSGKEIHYEAALRAVEKGFDSGSISRCCNGRSKTHKGLEWRYAERGVKWGKRALMELPTEWESS